MSDKEPNLPSPTSYTHSESYHEAEDEISLKDLIFTLWRHRSIIVVLSLSVIIMIAAVASWVYLMQEDNRTVKLEFKLEFEGVDKNQYPNGLKFSTADILSTPVLNRVYEQNDLKRYLQYPDFKAGLTIFQINDKLKFLEYEYSEKLSRKDLSLEERERLEAEFLEKKNTALLPIYTLLINSSASMNSVPEELIAKVLHDILRIWANHADRVKGVNKYQYSLASRNILSEKNLDEEDYLIATDMLRITLDRVRDDIKKLQQIPGATAAKAGENAVSLQDLQFRIEDIRQFKLSPLVGLIRQAGVSKEKALTLGYLRNRLFDLNLEEEAATANVNVYENSLSQYIQRTRGALTTPTSSTALTPSLKQGIPGSVPAMIPQFGASFLDSLIEMAQENSDMLFRQQISEKVIDAGLKKVKINIDKKYYQELYDRIIFDHAEDDTFESYKKSALERINQTHQEIYLSLMQTIDDINAIYLNLSKYNLNPESLFYSVTKPVTIASMKLLTPRKTLIYFIIASILAVFAIVIGVLLVSSISGVGQEKSLRSDSQTSAKKLESEKRVQQPPGILISS